MSFTMGNGKHRCAFCKGDLVGLRNGDLHCWKCNKYTDPDEPTEKHQIEEALYELVGWKNCGEKERDDIY